jgi:hypothetical protein
MPGCGISQVTFSGFRDQKNADDHERAPRQPRQSGGMLGKTDPAEMIE